MIISVITLFPEIFKPFINTSIIKKASEKGLVKFNLVSMMDFSAPKVRIDTQTVGHGPGMIIKPDIIQAAIEKCEASYGTGFKIFFSPQGKTLDQNILRILANKFKDAENSQNLLQKHSDTEQKNHIILICPRYEGIDERVEEEYSDLTISIGNYVLMGGDIPAQVFLEGFLRLMPGIVGNNDSLDSESFESPLLDHPEYGQPSEWKNKKIPEILTSGNHKKIQDWRESKAIDKTIKTKFEWFRNHRQAPEFAEKALKALPPHYSAIMYDQVLTKHGETTTTSIKSMDLHDISRSAATYGIRKLFIITPLKDQQSIAQEFLKFWTNKEGHTYNASRYHAAKKIVIVNSLEEALEIIKKEENKDPSVIATSAKKHKELKEITFHDQEKVFSVNLPVLIIFGTGYGLTKTVIKKCNFIFSSIRGLPEYNHLSVRCAAAIIFDRWLGLNKSL